MIWRSIVLYLGFLSLLCAGADTLIAQEPAENAAIPETETVGFGILTFDLSGGRLRRSAVDQGIKDCSNNEFNCLIAGKIRIVLPKKCTQFKSAKAGDRWELGGVTTELLWYQPLGALKKWHGADTRGYYFGSADIPDVVFHYQPELGIMAIFSAELLNFNGVRSQGTDLYTLAKRGVLAKDSLPVWLSGTYNSLSGSRKIMQCAP